MNVQSANLNDQIGISNDAHPQIQNARYVPDDNEFVIYKLKQL